MSRLVNRRGLIGALGAGAGGLLLSGCDRINAAPAVQGLLRLGEGATMGAQRLVSNRAALAPEFSASEMSPVFRTNGNTMPRSPDYAAHVANRFADWRLVIDGMVARPLSLSLEQIGRLPRRTQITRHDCVEGWSAIGQWTGLPLGMALREAGLSTNARYIAFHCADDFGGTPYYESVDIIDALHSADHPRLGDERHHALGQPWRAAPPPGRAPAWLQAGQICHARRGGSGPCRFRRGQGRLLGGRQRLPMVCRRLMSVLVFYGSYRSDRAGIRLADYIVAGLEARGTPAELIDAKAIGLPMLDRMHKEYAPGEAPTAMAELAEKIRAADAFVFVAGEYNWGVQPGLKNLTDHYLEEWFWRPAGIASYSAGRIGGARANLAWHGTLAEMGMVVIPSTLTIGPITQTLDETGRPHGDAGAALDRAFARFADELDWWAEAARGQRGRRPPPY